MSEPSTGFVSVKAEVKSIGEDDEFPGRFEVVASTKAIDRDGESVRHKALTLPGSAPFFVDHDWKSGGLPVGRGVPSYDDDNMKAVGSWASTPRAQEIRTLVREGIIDSCSIGFMNAKRETTKGLREVVAGDLFEISFTALPINTEARVLAAKALGVDADHPARSDRKAIEGSVEALQDRVRDALDDAYGEYVCWLRGVLPDAVVFNRGEDTFRQTYTDDGAVVTLTGIAAEVDIHEIVVPDADAATEPPEGDDGATTLSLPGSTGDAPASAGASPVDPEQAKAIAAARMRQAGLTTD